jgi:hypothetical protein
VCATLADVLPEHRIVVSEDSPKVGEERVGLSFAVVEALAGRYLPGDVVVIEGVGYEIDLLTGERVAEIVLDGHGPTDWVIGADYCFLLADTGVGLQFRSWELVGRLTPEGLLVPLLLPNSAPDGAKLASVDGLRLVVAEATK